MFGRDVAHPDKGLFAKAFKSTGTCAWFPYPTAYKPDLRQGFQGHSDLLKLFAALYAAGTCHNKWSVVYRLKHFAKIRNIFDMLALWKHENKVSEAAKLAYRIADGRAGAHFVPL